MGVYLSVCLAKWVSEGLRVAGLGCSAVANGSAVRPRYDALATDQCSPRAFAARSGRFTSLVLFGGAIARAFGGGGG